MTLSTSAAAGTVASDFCFDCPDKTFGFYADSIVAGLGISLVLAVPGFFIGMLIHRIMVRVWLPIRLLAVAVCVSVLWYSMVGRIDLVIVSASLLAAFASYLDGKRVDAEKSVKSFSE